MSDDARLAELESRLAYQDDQIHAMNLELVQQQKLIGDLSAQIAELRRQLRAMSPADADPGHQPPPHY